jgi:1,4-alpha-glucan branching enzyme
MAETTLDRATAEAIAGGWHGDPFAVLGPHKRSKGWEITAFVPGAERLWVLAGKTEADEAVPYPGCAGPVHPPDGAEGWLSSCAREGHGHEWEFDDPFRFGPVLGELDEYLLGEGTHKPACGRCLARI